MPRLPRPAALAARPPGDAGLHPVRAATSRSSPAWSTTSAASPARSRCSTWSSSPPPPPCSPTRTAIVLANLAWTFYAGADRGAPGGRARDPRRRAPSSPAFFSYNLAVHLVGFYAVALLTSYLAQNASRAESELERRDRGPGPARDLPPRRHPVDRERPHHHRSRRARDERQPRRADHPVGAAETELVGQPIGPSACSIASEWDFAGAGAAPTDAAATELAGQARLGADPSRVLGQPPAPTATARTRGFIFIFQDCHPLAAARRSSCASRTAWPPSASWRPGWRTRSAIRWPRSRARCSCCRRACRRRRSGHRLLEIILKESQRLDRTIKGFLRFARPARARRRRASTSARLLRREHGAAAQQRGGHRPATASSLELDPASVRLIGRSATRSARSSGTWRATRCARCPTAAGSQCAGASTRRRLSHRVHGHRPRHDRGAAPKLFQPFQSFFDGGTGIGMAIVYRIVQEHGGELSVESTPAARHHGRPSTCPLEPRGASSRRRRPGRELASLLIVDDEASLLDFLTLLVRAGGLPGDDRRARSPTPATCSATNDFDLVLCDMMMPDGNGLDLLREIKQSGDAHLGHHDDRLHLDQDGDRGDEARRLRLRVQAVRRRGAQDPGAEGAREDRALRRERLPAPRARAALRASATSSAAARGCRRSSG